MAKKVSKNQIKSNFENIICVGYCDLQKLLRYHRPIAYTTGIYRWNADVYIVGSNTVIVTGYRPFGNIEVPYEVCQRYEELAEQANEKETTELLKDFVKTALLKDLVKTAIKFKEV